MALNSIRNFRNGRFSWSIKYWESTKSCFLIWSEDNALLIVFFDTKDAVHYESVPEGITVAGAFLGELQKRLKGNVNRVRSLLPPIQTCFITMPQATPVLYSTTAYPGKATQLLKGHRHGTVDKIKTASTICLKDVLEKDFQCSFHA